MRDPASRQRSALLAVPLGILVVLTTAACAGTSVAQVATDATTTTGSTTTTTTTPPDCADTLPTRAKASQLLMTMVEDPASVSEPLKAGLIGGFGLKGNQRSDVGETLTEVTADTPLPATVAVDEEGGTVQRLRYPVGRLPSAREMAEGTPQEAAEQFAEHATLMADLGITMNFAPVADVGESKVLGTRTYGDDPDTVAGFASAVAQANLDAGVVPVVKHWPGIGGSSVDPHNSLPTLSPIDELRANDLRAFDTVIAGGVPAVMVAHAEVPGLTATGEPASLSRAAITDELRGREGFDGVVITDSLGMGAIVNNTTQNDASEAAILAGADIALLSGTDAIEDAHAQLVSAIDEGRIPADQVTESVRRVLALKGIEGECLDAVSAFGALGRIESDALDEEGLDGAAQMPGTDQEGTGEGDGRSTGGTGDDDDSTGGDTGGSGNTNGNGNGGTGGRSSTTGEVVDRGINDP